MNARSLLLAFSLIANAALLGAYLLVPAAPAPAKTTAVATAAAASRPSPKSSGTPTTAAAASSEVAKAGFSWSAIQTDDLDELVRRLKGAGFTPREIRTIMQNEISRRWGLARAGGDTTPPAYWRATRTASLDAKAREEMRQRDQEYARLSRKYTWGPDRLLDDPESQDLARRQWGDLPLAKLQALAVIDDDYAELQMQFTENRNRPGERSSDVNVYRMLEKERTADIAAVLTPEEFAAFELRGSTTARALRSQLSGFDATEEEYKAIYAISQPYTERLFDPNLGADGRKALQAEISAKVKETLGADRALDYDAVTNYNAQDQTGLLVSRLGLPPRIAVEVRQVQQDFSQQGKDIRANASLTPYERNAQLAALARQAEVQLTATLGAEGFEAYAEVKGDWIRALKTTGSP